MASHRLIQEWAARLLLIILVIGVPVAAVAARQSSSREAVEVHAAMPEAGGWMPGSLNATVGEPLHLHLISDDVMHSFAVAKTDWPAIDLKPGQMSETTLTFEEPGTYTYYCTRWCGPNHWRMRGTILVEGGQDTQMLGPDPAPYISLGIDLDAPHVIDAALADTPSAQRAGRLNLDIPQQYLTRDVYESQTPVQIWRQLREDPISDALSNTDVWDLVAFIWRSHITPDALRVGAALYAQNCAACHGETGAGDGVMAAQVWETAAAMAETMGDAHLLNSSFIDSRQMLGASSALLHGKIVRGGMGTGMPNWGPIFSEEEIWSLVDTLWAFQFPSGDLDLDQPNHLESDH